MASLDPQYRPKNEQLEMYSDGSDDGSPLSEDYDDKVASAKRELAQLQQKQLELEEKQRYFEEINQRKSQFLNGQVEVSEKFSTALTSADREIYQMRAELSEIEELRECFAKHARTIDSINPESWTKDVTGKNLEKAIALLQRANDDYDTAVAHFSQHTRSKLFSEKRKVFKVSGGRDFTANFLNGLAFNLPLIVALIILAFVFHLLK